MIRIILAAAIFSSVAISELQAADTMAIYESLRKPSALATTYDELLRDFFAMASKRGDIGRAVHGFIQLHQTAFFQVHNIPIKLLGTALTLFLE